MILLQISTFIAILCLVALIGSLITIILLIRQLDKNTNRYVNENKSSHI